MAGDAALGGRSNLPSPIFGAAKQSRKACGRIEPGASQSIEPSLPTIAALSQLPIRASIRDGMGPGGKKSSFRKQCHHGKRLPHRTGFSHPTPALAHSFETIGAVLSSFQATAERGQVQTERHRARGYSSVAVLAMLEVAT
jgi:hypothetical protein